jgi:hypothetical protein
LLGCSSLLIVSYFRSRRRRSDSDYLAGRWTLDASENYQVGFRLAKALNHKQVYLISSSVPFNYDSLRKHALAHHQEWLLAAQVCVDSALVESAQMSRGLERYSIFLGFTTLKTPFGRTMARMYLARIGSDNDPIGARFVAEWHRRNLHLFVKLTHLIGGENERILVLYGQGHGFSSVSS